MRGLGHLLTNLSVHIVGMELSLNTLKMEATHSSETSVYNKPTRRQIPEDGIL
jgi:hypothetical protein